jgi:hypothetical protein
MRFQRDFLTWFNKHGQKIIIGAFQQIEGGLFDFSPEIKCAVRRNLY